MFLLLYSNIKHVISLNAWLCAWCVWITYFVLLPLIINKRRSWSSKLGSFKLGVVYFFFMRCALILENGMSNLDMYSVITAFF